jgi:excinuclease ABC subunit C
VNLKARVNSYFNGKTKLNFAKQKMVEQICDIKTILTNNETESIILETTLIKKHLPKYNILMKDGKNHIYLKITSEPIPKLIRTRTPPSVPPLNKGRLGGVYFGPYTSSNYVNNIIKITKKIF